MVSEVAVWINGFYSFSTHPLHNLSPSLLLCILWIFSKFWAQCHAADNARWEWWMGWLCRAMRADNVRPAYLNIYFGDFVYFSASIYTDMRHCKTTSSLRPFGSIRRWMCSPSLERFLARIFLGCFRFVCVYFALATQNFAQIWFRSVERRPSFAKAIE